MKNQPECSVEVSSLLHPFLMHHYQTLIVDELLVHLIRHRAVHIVAIVLASQIVLSGRKRKVSLFHLIIHIYHELR